MNGTNTLSGLRALVTILSTLNGIGQTADAARVLRIAGELSAVDSYTNEFRVADLKRRASLMQALTMACAEAMVDDRVRKVTLCVLLRQLDKRFDLRTVKLMCDEAQAIGKYMLALQDDNKANAEAERQRNERAMQITHLFSEQKAVRGTASEYLRSNLTRLANAD